MSNRLKDGRYNYQTQWWNKRRIHGGKYPCGHCGEVKVLFGADDGRAWCKVCLKAEDRDIVALRARVLELERTVGDLSMHLAHTLRMLRRSGYVPDPTTPEGKRVTWATDEIRRLEADAGLECDAG